MGSALYGGQKSPHLSQNIDYLSRVVRVMDTPSVNRQFSSPWMGRAGGESP